MRQRHAADHQAIVDNGPARHGSMIGKRHAWSALDVFGRHAIRGSGHRAHAEGTKISRNSVLSALRSIFPLGFLGSGPSRISTRAGTMKPGRRSRQTESKVFSSIMVAGFGVATTTMH